MMDISSLLNIYFANIFFYSVGFISFLMVSSEAQMFFHFILFFPTVQHGDPVILTCISFFPDPLFCCNMSIQT